MLVLATPTNPGTAAFLETTAVTGSVTQLGSTGGEIVSSSTLAAQTLVTIPVAAGLMNAVGNTLWLRTLLRVLATDGVVTVACDYKIGTATMVSFPAVLPTGTGKARYFDLCLRCVTTGASGTLSVAGSFGGDFDSGAPPLTVAPLPTFTADLTVAPTFTIQVTFSAVTAPVTDNQIQNVETVLSFASS
jgi:hypothetical protein